MSPGIPDDGVGCARDERRQGSREGGVNPIAGGLIALLLAATATAAEPRAWELQAGTGPSEADVLQLSRGHCWSLGIATPVRPGLWVGAGAEWHEFRSGRGSTMTLEPYVYERSRVVAGLANVRVQAPVRTGLVPYALVECGAGRASLADLRWTLNDPRTEPRRAGFVWVAGAGVGLRLALPPGWPELDASLRGGVWSSPVPLFRASHRTGYTALRLSVAWSRPT